MLFHWCILCPNAEELSDESDGISGNVFMSQLWLECIWGLEFIRLHLIIYLLGGGSPPVGLVGASARFDMAPSSRISGPLWRHLLFIWSCNVITLSPWQFYGITGVTQDVSQHPNADWHKHCGRIILLILGDVCSHGDLWCHEVFRRTWTTLSPDLGENA